MSRHLEKMANKQFADELLESFPSLFNAHDRDDYPYHIMFVFISALIEEINRDASGGRVEQICEFLNAGARKFGPPLANLLEIQVHERLEDEGIDPWALPLKEVHRLVAEN